VYASTLRDGASVMWRRLESADIDAVIALHDTLSDHDRCLRFSVSHPKPLKALASQLSDDSGRNYALDASEFGTLGSASQVASYTSTSIWRNSDLSLTEL
jgi:hypothetical protein